MRKTILICSLFIFCIATFSKSSYNISDNKKIIKTENEGIDYKKKYEIEAQIDPRLERLFSAIRSHRNKYVKAYLKTNDNLEIREKWVEENLKEGVYSPANDYTIYPITDTTLIDVNSQDRHGYTPIIVAIEAKNNEILELLLDNGADVMTKHPVFGRLTLHTAAYYQNEEAVDILLKRAPQLVNEQSGNDGWLALQDATLKSNVKIVKKLLEYGANPLIRDYNGGTAMDMATEFGKGEIVKLLRDNIKSRRK